MIVRSLLLICRYLGRGHDSTPTEIYRLMLTDKKYGLSISWMATRAMPSLLPHAINPALTLEQFELLLKILQDMLNHIERWRNVRYDCNFACEILTDNRQPLSFYCFSTFSTLLSVSLLIYHFSLIFWTGIRGINWPWTICHYRARTGTEVFDTNTVRIICTLRLSTFQTCASSNARLPRPRTWLGKIAQVRINESGLFIQLSVRVRWYGWFKINPVFSFFGRFNVDDSFSGKHGEKELDDK